MLGGQSEPPASAAQTVCCKELLLTLQFVPAKGPNALQTVREDHYKKFGASQTTEVRHLQANHLLRVDYSA